MVGMTMNKKGFTLIELIATIGLMVLMGIIIANNITSIFSKQEDADIENFKSTLESAACVYIDLSDPSIKAKKEVCKSSGCTVTTNVLIQNGLLDEKLKNPYNKKKILGTEVISIKYISGEKTCTYSLE